MAGRAARLRRPGRRQWLGALIALGAASSAGWLRARVEAAQPNDPRTLRPPGAGTEEDFLGACLRCGLCVKACPFDVLRLADAAGPVPRGTPYFNARASACRMCEDVPCQPVCPTSALGPAGLRIGDARMGLAAVRDEARCYSIIGAARCNACWKACPLQEQAITMKPGLTARGGRFTPTVDARVCTGCGLCEQFCIADPPAITVERVV